MKNLIKNEQSGRSMVEMLGVLAIIGVLSVGGISGYSKAMAKFKMTKAQDQISMLLMNIRTAFSGSSNFAGLDNSTAIKLNIVPGDMLPSGLGKPSGDIINAFSGEVILGVGTGSQADQHFTLSFGGLGKETCTSLASSDWGTEGLLKMTVNTEEYIQSKLPIKATDAVTDCSVDDSKNVIVWEYY